jgi:ligand-binding sensor domain-containing protein
VNAILPFGGEDTLIIGLRRGILLFDKKSGRFSRDPRFAALAQKNIVSIRADGQGRIWIGTSGALYRYDGQKLKLLTEISPEARRFDFSRFQLTFMIYDTLRSGLWVGGSRPFFVDCKSNRLYFKGNNPLNSPMLESEHVNAIALDRSGNVWYGCEYGTDAELLGLSHRQARQILRAGTASRSARAVILSSLTGKTGCGFPPGCLRRS